MIVLLDMLGPATVASVVSVETHAMCHSLTHSEPVYSFTSGQSVSNVVGNDCSESMRELCGCVSFSLSTNAQVYAPQSSWYVQEPKERVRKTDAHTSMTFFLPHFSVFFCPHVM